MQGCMSRHRGAIIRPRKCRALSLHACPKRVRVTPWALPCTQGCNATFLVGHSRRLSQRRAYGTNAGKRRTQSCSPQQRSRSQRTRRHRESCPRVGRSTCRGRGPGRHAGHTKSDAPSSDVPQHFAWNSAPAHNRREHDGAFFDRLVNPFEQKAHTDS